MAGQTAPHALGTHDGTTRHVVARRSVHPDGLWGGRLAPNCVSRGKNDKRVFIADELDTCRDYSGVVFQLPFQRVCVAAVHTLGPGRTCAHVDGCVYVRGQGYLVNWDVETTVWDLLLGATRLQCDPADAALLLSEPVCNLPAIADACDQFVFEDYGFHAYCRATGTRGAEVARGVWR
jgi:actin-related protein 6